MIRKADELDSIDLYGLVLDYLKEIKERGSEIEPTERSVSLYVEMAIEGDAVCLVAEQDGELVGFTMASEVSLPYDHDMGLAALAWGTYVVPELRGRGVADDLRESLHAVLRAAGVNTYLGAVHGQNTPGLKSAAHLAQPFQSWFRFNLGEQGK